MNRRLLFGLLAIFIVLSGAAFPHAPALASDVNAPPGPDRYSTVTVNYTAFTWQMKAWSGRTKLTCIIVVGHAEEEPYPWETFRDCGEIIPDKWLSKTPCGSSAGTDKVCWKGLKTIACVITVDHEGMPLSKEVLRDCSETVYKDWVKQAPCNELDKTTCAGYYVHLINEEKKQKQVSMQLEPASAWISLEDCQPVLSASTNICETTPTLVITGQEPLPNESINRIEGTYNDEPFNCDSTNICKFHIPETPAEGVSVEFWSYSTYGDSSIVYTAQVRVQRSDQGDPDQLYWYVDVLSSQWKGEVVATCADAWGVFPPVGGVPQWLTTPVNSEELSSNIPYTYLAANLIKQGVVNAGSCSDGGITPGGAANPCGLKKARPAVKEWQNQFDALIFSVAQDTSVPARLLKNLFARESQFWPGIYQSMGDAGLGQLTENGADTTLFWNDSFYGQFCPIVLSEDICGLGYMHLPEEYQVQLRRALVSSVNATCEDCPLGLDLTQSDFSVSVFAHTMIANCEQTGQVVYNYTGQSVDNVAAYEDLWKFTLVNYNAGGGCLSGGISNAYSRGLDLTWNNVSPYLTGACSGAVNYVNDISKDK